MQGPAGGGGGGGFLMLLESHLYFGVSQKNCLSHVAHFMNNRLVLCFYFI